MARLFDVLWVVLIVVILHKTLLPWLGLTNGMAIAIAVLIVIVGNAFAYFGLFSLLRSKLAGTGKKEPASTARVTGETKRSETESEL